MKSWIKAAALLAVTALTLGVVGNTMGLGARTHAMRPLVEQADVVLLVGNRTNQNGTDSWSATSSMPASRPRARTSPTSGWSASVASFFSK